MMQVTSGKTGVLSSLKPVLLNSKATAITEERESSAIGEFDRVLGGGFVSGSLVLLGGDPGIGKSTLMLHAALNLSRAGHKVLYWSGEESAQQIRLRAKRLDMGSSSIWLMPESCLDHLETILDEETPDYLIIDSIQTVYQTEVGNTPGSPSQVRDITAKLMRLAKTRDLTVIIIGHVTKEGNIAGPKMLEHMVDAVLYFEGERQHSYRILRAVKNRYGSTNEIGVFTMAESGLTEVANPSELFLSERSQQGPGSAITTILEGSRPLLIEIQALLTQSTFQNPRRLANGFDSNRLTMLLAILEKRLGLPIGFNDAYINVAGGIKVSEPAADLAVALAMWSSFRDQPLPRDCTFIGEIGLTGEVRGVSQTERRLHEALKLGFTTAYLPASQAKTKIAGLKLVGVKHLRDVVQIIGSKQE